MRYEGRDIVRLDSHINSVPNIGNRPLVQLPVRIECVEGGKILGNELLAPDGASCAAVLEEPGKLIATTDLLNPGEVVTIGLTVSDSPSGNAWIISRGELLNVKQIGERADTAELLEALLPHRPFFGGLLLDLYRLTSPRGRR